MLKHTSKSWVMAVSGLLLAIAILRGQAIRPPVSVGPPPTQPTTSPADPYGVVSAANNANAAILAQTQPIPVPSTCPTTMPADVVYQPVAHYDISNTGSDTLGTGTPSNPFASIKGALAQITTDRANGFIPPASATAIVEISYHGGQKFTQDFTNASINENHLLFDTYGKDTWGCAEIDSPGIAFQKIPNVANPAGLHLQYLDLVSTNTTTAITYGLSVNQVNDVSADYCSFSGFTFNINAAWMTDGLRIAYCYSEKAHGVAGSESGTGFFVDQATHVDTYGNFHWQDGCDRTVYSPAWWADVSNSTPGHVPTTQNAALLQNVYFFHAEYWRVETQWEPVHPHDCVYLDCAATGCQLRASGTATRCLFGHNGASVDSFCIGPSGGYDTVALFGESVEDFDYWGQGLQIQTVSGFARHVYAISASTLTQNPVVQVSPSVMTAESGGAVLPSPTPIPTTQAVVDDVHAVWPVNRPNQFPPPAGVWVDPSRTATTVVTNITVRAPRTGEQVLTYPAVYGFQTDEQVAALWKANFRNWRNDPRITAMYGVNAAKAWLAANP